MDFLPYTKPSLTPEDLKEIQSAFDSPFITRGPKTKAFEEKMAQYCQVPYAVSFNSGTSALEAACYALEICDQDTVFSSPNTFVGTLSGALKKTNRLQFLDIDPLTKSPNYTHLPLPENQRSILMAVHFSGMAKKIPRHKNLKVIEDACQALGAKYPDGTPVGSCMHSEMSVFSFHPAKTLCSGEGGLVTTRSYKLYERLLLFRNNGITKSDKDPLWVYLVHDLTGNYHIHELGAAMGLSQLKNIETHLAKRRELVRYYRKVFKDIEEVKLPDPSYDLLSSHNLFVVEIDFEKLGQSRDEIMKAFRKLHIQTQVHFIPLYHHPYFKKHYSFKKEDFPFTEAYYSKALSLPLFSHMTFEEIDRVKSAFLEIFKTSKISHG